MLNGNGRSHTLLIGALGVLATVSLGVASWVLITLVDVRDRVLKIEATRPLYEERLLKLEHNADLRR